MTDIQVSKKRPHSPSLALEIEDTENPATTKRARPLSLLPKDDSLPQDMWFTILDVLREEALGMSCWAMLMLAQTSHGQHELIQAYFKRYPFNVTLRVLSMVGITRWPAATLLEWLIGPARFIMQHTKFGRMAELLRMRFILHKKLGDAEAAKCLTTITAVIRCLSSGTAYLRVLTTPLLHYAIERDLGWVAQDLITLCQKKDPRFLTSHAFTTEYDAIPDDRKSGSSIHEFSTECILHLLLNDVPASLNAVHVLATNDDFYSSLLFHALEHHAFRMLDFLTGLLKPATLAWNIALLPFFYWLYTNTATLVFDVAQMELLLPHVPIVQLLTDDSPFEAHNSALCKLIDIAAISGNLVGLQGLSEFRRRYIQVVNTKVITLEEMLADTEDTEQAALKRWEESLDE